MVKPMIHEREIFDEEGGKKSSSVSEDKTGNSDSLIFVCLKKNSKVSIQLRLAVSAGRRNNKI